MVSSRVTEIDAFLSYASEDRHTFALPLASALRRIGASIWCDEYDMPTGERLARMDEGIKRAKFGVVLISQYYAGKYWTDAELSGLRARAAIGNLGLVPIWYGVDAHYIARTLPTLAGVRAIGAGARSAEEVAFDVIGIVRPDLREYVHARFALTDRIMRKITSSAPEKITPSKVERGPIIHTQFSIHVHSRLRLLQAILEDVFDSPIDEWLDNFARDWHPHKELVWWEFIAATYLKVIYYGGVNQGNKSELFRAMVDLMNSDSTGINSFVERIEPSKRQGVIEFLNGAAEVRRAIFGDKVAAGLFNPPEIEDA